MIKLEFESKISGVRCDLPNELRKEMENDLNWVHSITPHEVPDFVFYGIWWSFKGMSLEILFLENGTDVKVRKSNTREEVILTDYYSKSLYDCLIGSLNMDDQEKVWLYNNKPYIWNQLIDRFGSSKKVFNAYIRFNH